MQEALVQEAQISSTCSICGSKTILAQTEYYVCCSSCGHEARIQEPRDNLIINDPLDLDWVKKKDLLENFKASVLNKFTRSWDSIVDLGSASGKFLFHQKQLFKHHLGIEITPESVNFSKEVLGLHISDTLDTIEAPASVVTSWHSLEHIPIEPLHKLLEKLSKKISKNCVFIVSVPNSQSLLYTYLGEKYPYYDPYSHWHTFSIDSLDLLLEKYGWKKVQNVWSFPYSLFGYIQGGLNLVLPIRNYFYYRKKRSWTFGLSKKKLLFFDAVNYIFIPFILPVAFLFSLFDMIQKEKGAVITAVYEN